ncbi:MAG: hypothetical protein E6J79_20890 [Deltaproteobacteria bacterium]|nr:MAG: hypothetical protein E6J79_20890 [Deltaproteobacteria bacterium]
MPENAAAARFFISFGETSFLHAAEAVAPEHVLDRHEDLGARLDGLGERLVDVGDVEEQQRRLRRLLERIVQHDNRVADLELGVHDLSARPRHAHPFLRAESLLAEVDGLDRVGLIQGGRDGVVALRDRPHLLRHASSWFWRRGR